MSDVENIQNTFRVFDFQCIKNKGSAESNGEIVGASLVTATPAASTLSNIPIIGWIASAVAVKKAGQLGKDIGGDFVDC